MSCYRANPLSRNDIRHFVRWLKKTIGLESTLYFPVIQFLENILPMLMPDFQLEIAPTHEMGSNHGQTYPSKHLIRIREDVYLRAVAGYGRDRLTIAHEIGHLFMHKEDSIALCRLAPDESLKPYENPEWQADAFGGELLASSYLIKGMDVLDVQSLCGVTASAARVQLKHS